MIKKISREFCVSTKTERYIYELNMTGDISSKSQRHGPSPQMSEFEELTILEMLLEKPSMYLRDLQQELLCITRSWYDCATICRAVKRLGMTRQKLHLVARQRCDIQQAWYISQIMAKQN